MKKAGFILFLSGFLLFLASPSQATLWIDEHTPTPQPLYMAAGGVNGGVEEYGFEFDLKNDGFDPYGLDRDYALWFEVEFSVSDDFNDDGLSDGYEILTATSGWLQWNEQSYEVGLNIGGPLGDPLIYDDSPEALIGLNFFNDGVLHMDLTATLGDFNLWGARLTASDQKVPEPATMLLLGVGLLGLAGIGHRKFFKK